MDISPSYCWAWEDSTLPLSHQCTPSVSGSFSISLYFCFRVVSWIMHVFYQTFENLCKQTPTNWFLFISMMCLIKSINWIWLFMERQLKLTWQTCEKIAFGNIYHFFYRSSQAVHKLYQHVFINITKPLIIFSNDIIVCTVKKGIHKIYQIIPASCQCFDKINTSRNHFLTVFFQWKNALLALK